MVAATNHCTTSWEWQKTVITDNIKAVVEEQMRRDDKSASQSGLARIQVKLKDCSSPVAKLYWGVHSGEARIASSYVQ